MTQHATALYWFRRALRLDDNRSLRAALASSQRVVPVFIVDPDILTGTPVAPVRLRFLWEGLAALDRSLRDRGSRLILRQGKPEQVLPRLLLECKASAVFFACEYEPWGRARDARVRAALERIGASVVDACDHLLVEPGTLRTRSGAIPTVFTPFYRQWERQTFLAPIDPPEELPDPGPVPSDPIPEPPPGAPPPPIDAGEAAAWKRFEEFAAGAVEEYGLARDYPERAGTSRLSAALKFGMISPRRIVARLKGSQGGTSGEAVFLRELAWRDFFYQVLAEFPHVAHGSFRPQFDRFVWDEDEARFAAWRDGRTGYPFIDAAMRELNATGWMHNRARMAVASFLTKDLRCHWRHGERYFLERLVDGDQAANNGAWQWAAGTGTDAQPYFRIFHPVAQGERFDPHGAFVRRWVPELAALPDRYIHRPFALSAVDLAAAGVRLGKDYPYPIVDHKVERAETLRRFRLFARKDAGT